MDRARGSEDHKREDAVGGAHEDGLQEAQRQIHEQRPAVAARPVDWHNGDAERAVAVAVAGIRVRKERARTAFHVRAQQHVGDHLGGLIERQREDQEEEEHEVHTPRIPEINAPLHMTCNQEGLK